MYHLLQMQQEGKDEEKKTRREWKKEKTFLVSQVVTVKKSDLLLTCKDMKQLLQYVYNYNDCTSSKYSVTINSHK